MIRRMDLQSPSRAVVHRQVLPEAICHQLDGLFLVLFQLPCLLHVLTRNRTTPSRLLGARRLWPRNSPEN